jgi:uncharacterized protein YndB with AHSA1/START domain
MTVRSTKHATFKVERSYPASPERVYDAWSNPASKAKWFSGPHDAWTLIERTMDFRVGGHERVSGRFRDSGVVSSFACYYQDVVPGQRIVYSYDMTLNEVRISVSVACIEIKPQGNGTLLTVTEHGVFLDDYDDAGSREQGTRSLLEQLASSLG